MTENLLKCLCNYIYSFRASAGSKLALGWELQKGSAPFESDVPFEK